MKFITCIERELNFLLPSFENAFLKRLIAEPKELIRMIGRK
jgi:hypothetical protein